MRSGRPLAVLLAIAVALGGAGEAATAVAKPAKHKHHKKKKKKKKKPAALGPLAVTVVGNHLENGQGARIRLLGANRSGTEYACAQGWGTFDSPDPANPDSDAMVAAMAAWKMTAVRVPLNEQCWLGIGGVSASLGGENYRQRIQAYVDRLHAHGLYAILDLHMAAPGSVAASTAVTGLRPMPDADHSPDFWSSVAARFIADRRVVFDLYNEPHDVSWACLRDGCTVPNDQTNGAIPSYQAAGMQSLVNAVRSTGSVQPVMVGGLGYSGDLSQWLAYKPSDPKGQVIASFHNYEGPDIGACFLACWESTIAPVAQSVPVVTGELGDSDLTNMRCDHDYIDQYMPWADSHGISYLGWTWDSTASGWSCGSGPALITNYDGTPNGYGVGLRDHLLALPPESPAKSPAKTKPKKKKKKKKHR